MVQVEQTDVDFHFDNIIKYEFFIIHVELLVV